MDLVAVQKATKLPVLKFVPRCVGGMELEFDPCSSVGLKQDRFFPLQKGADGCMSYIHRPQFKNSPLKNGLLEDYFPFKMVNL